VNDDLNKLYELLGVAPGVSVQELKAAHRDLAKVWHPDRFAHDPRLQQKAQEKLKEINEAYDQLASGKAARRARASSATENPSYTPPQASARRTRGKLVVLPILAFAVLFFVALRTLLPLAKPSAQSGAQTAEQAQAPLNEDGQQPDSVSKPRAVESPRAKRAEQQLPETAKASDTSVTEQDLRQMRPLPTVTLTIDPVSALLAKADCPTKSRMTYPSGSEPRQYCNVSHQSNAPEQADQPRPKESRLKSFARRIAAPAKLFSNKEATSRNP
jgi:DnaJ domain